MRRFQFSIAIYALVLAGCSSGGVENEKRQALKSYTACLDKAAAKVDDGKDDAMTVAKAISPKCLAEYEKVIRVNNPQDRKEFDAAMLAKQLDFTATYVADRRKSRFSN